MIFQLCTQKSKIKNHEVEVTQDGKVKKTSITPADYGNYILQKRKRGKKNGS